MGKVCSTLCGRNRGGIDVVRGIVREAEQLIHDAEQITTIGNAGPDLTATSVGVKQIPLTGQHRSLLIGCNYVGTQNELHGCANDVKRMVPALASLGFPSDNDNQRVLLDEEGSPVETKPTRANMLEAFKWLVDGAKAGDALFLHYSGHGGREPASDGGYCETLVPLDFQTAGMLKDTDLFDVLVKPLPHGCRLTCILDSCHSAGALNLPYIFVGSEAELQRALAGEAVKMALATSWKKDLHQWIAGSRKELLNDVGALGKNLWRMYHEGQTGFLTDEKDNCGVAIGEVVAITGCRSDQTSADVWDVSSFGLSPVSGDRSAGGALTSALTEALQDPDAQQMTYADLLDRMRKELVSKGFSQVPQFVSSLLVELKQPFKLDTIWVPSDDNEPQ